MKRKGIGLFLVLALTIGLIGCSGSGKEAGTDKSESGTTKAGEGAETDGTKLPFDGETVTVYTRNVDMPGWQPFVDLVKEKTGITVEGVVAPSNYSDVVTKLSSILTAGDDSFDIVHVDELLGVTYSTAGYLEPINEIIEAEKENYPEDVLERISKGADGNYYLLPQELNAMYFYVNKDVLEDSGAEIPTNQEEFLAAAKAMTKDDTYGYGASWSKGGQLFNDLIRWMYSFAETCTIGPSQNRRKRFSLCITCCIRIRSFQRLRLGIPTML